MSVLAILSSRLGPDTVSALAGRIGADESTTRSAIDAALPLLVSALAKNASTDTGAASLHRALSRDHDGSILEDVLGAVTSQGTASMGESILGHVLGGRREAVQGGLSQLSGLSEGQGSKLLALLAPLVLGALGGQARGNGLDAGALASMLGKQQAQAKASMPQGAGMLASLLDRDGDGSCLDDVGKMGRDMLSGFLGRKP